MSETCPNPKLPSSNRNNRIGVTLLHSPQHTKLIHSTLKHIHEDRDILLSSLLYCCGFLRQTPSFFNILPPRIATRAHLHAFHSNDYLDLIEYPPPTDSHRNRDYSSDLDDNDTHLNACESCLHAPPPSSIYTNNSCDNDVDTAYTNLLDAYGLTDDCAIPTNPHDRAQLWDYCRAVAGASLHASNLLLQGMSQEKHNHPTNINGSPDVVINWSGGRHHAHKDHAGGFCYVNDVVLAIQKIIHGPIMIKSSSSRRRNRVLYIDIDIHHADGVQAAFYDTDNVMTISLHRRAPGFFPSKTGSIHEKGMHASRGVGYNLNLPLPRGCKDGDLLSIIDLILDTIVPEYDPDVVVACVGADGLRHDNLVKETCEGWNLTPEGLAECVRRLASVCGCVDYKSGKVDEIGMRRRKLMVLGGGGYNPCNTARTYLLCTAAACEGARPGMLWEELPRDIPHHEFFDRYGPSFELISGHVVNGKYFHPDAKDTYDATNSSEYSRDIRTAKQAISLAHLFLSKKRLEREANDAGQMFSNLDEDTWPCHENLSKRPSTSGKRLTGRRRRKK